MLDERELIRIALESDASHAAIIETSLIQFHEDVRKACEQNVCRKYDTNWMGPPAIGPVSVLRQSAMSYEKGLLVQTVHRFGSGSEFARGMFSAAGVHTRVFREVLTRVRQAFPLAAILALNVGCCSVCERCAYLDHEPCRNPDLAFSSVEAYGINVMALQKTAGLPYNNGKHSLSYVSLFLLRGRT